MAKQPLAPQNDHCIICGADYNEYLICSETVCVLSEDDLRRQKKAEIDANNILAMSDDSINKSQTTTKSKFSKFFKFLCKDKVTRKDNPK